MSATVATDARAMRAGIPASPSDDSGTSTPASHATNVAPLRA
jgi:hypothetical protein